MGRGSSKRRGRGKGAGRGSGSSDASSTPGDPAGAGSSPTSPDGTGDDGLDDLEAFSRLHLWQFQVVRDLLVIAAVVFVIWVGYALRAVTVPLLVALLLAYLFEPLVARATRSKRFSREGAVIALLVTLTCSVLILGALVLPLVVHQSAQFYRFIRSDRLQNAVTQMVETAPTEPSAVLDWLKSAGGTGDEEHDDADAAASDGDGDGDGESDGDGASDGDGEATADSDAARDTALAGAEVDDGDPATAGDREDGAEADPAVAVAAADDPGTLVPEDPDAARARIAAEIIDAVELVVVSRNAAPLSASERLALEADVAAALAGDVTPLEEAAEFEQIVSAIVQRIVPGGGGGGAADDLPNGRGFAPGGVDYLTVLRNSVMMIGGFASALIELGLLSFLIPFYFYFFSVSYPAVLRFARSVVPDRNKERVFQLARRMDIVVAGFVRGRIVISVLMGVMFAIGWWICGVPYAIPVGLVVGVFSAVPYLGVVGIPLSIGLLAFDQWTQPGGSTMAWWLILGGPLLVFIIVQIVESYVLTPFIAGKATNLDPVTILVAVLAGGSVLGIYGMLLAIPLAACTKILIAEVLWPRFEAWTRGEAKDPLPIDR